MGFTVFFKKKKKKASHLQRVPSSTPVVRYKFDNPQPTNM